MFDIPEEVIIDALNKAIDVLMEKYGELGMKASGKWARELEIRTGRNHGEIWGMHYTKYLVHGRAPGKRPPIKAIEDWVGNKFGLHGRQATGVAFAIAKRIGEDGTTWYQQGGSDLLEVMDDQRVVDTFYTEIGSYLTVRVTEELRRILRELAA